MYDVPLAVDADGERALAQAAVADARDAGGRPEHRPTSAGPGRRG